MISSRSKTRTRTVKKQPELAKRKSILNVTFIGVRTQSNPPNFDLHNRGSTDVLKVITCINLRMDEDQFLATQSNWTTVVVKSRNTQVRSRSSSSQCFSRIVSSSSCIMAGRFEVIVWLTLWRMCFFSFQYTVTRSLPN